MFCFEILIYHGAGIFGHCSFCECNHTSAISTAAEATSVNASCAAHDFMKLNQDFTTRFIIFDRRFTRLIHQMSEVFKVCLLPKLGASSNAVCFTEEVSGAFAQVFRQCHLFLFEDCKRYIRKDLCSLLQ